MSRNKIPINKSTKKGISTFTCNLSSNLFPDVLCKLAIQSHERQQSVGSGGDQPLAPVLSERELGMAEPTETSTHDLTFSGTRSLVISIKQLASVTRRAVQQRYFQNSVKHSGLIAISGGERNSLFNLLLCKYYLVNKSNQVAVYVKRS